MILSPEKRDILNNNKVSMALFKEQPYAFFGWGLKYPKQFEAIKQWLEIQPKITVFGGWTRTGKTAVPVYLLACWFLGFLNKDWLGAKAMGIHKTSHWPHPVGRKKQAWIGGKSIDHVENVLLELYRSMLPSNVIKQDMTKNDKRIIGLDDTRLLIRTYEQDLETWKSGEADMIHLDEEPPLGVFKECLRRTNTTQGKIFISASIDDADVSWLPDACDNPIKYFGTDSFLHFKFGVEDVPETIFPQDEKDNTYRRYDGTPLELAVRKGAWASLSGKWVHKFNADLSVIDPFNIPEHWLKWRFIDAGIAAPSACTWIALHPKGDMFIYREYYKAGTTIDERCRDIVEMSGSKRQRDGDLWMEHEQKERYIATYLDHAEFKSDPITGDSVDFVYVKSGLQVQPWTTMGQEARREVINRWFDKDMKKIHFITREKGAPRCYIFNNCTNLIWEIQKKSVKREKTDRHGVSERKVDNRDDHLIDCVESACVELENWLGVSEKDFE